MVAEVRGEAPPAGGRVFGCLNTQGLIYELEDLETNIGRGEECDIVLDGQGISRMHACLTFLRGGTQPRLKDLGSSNGTFVNNTRLSPNVPQALAHGDTVQFSCKEKRTYVFELPESPAGPAAPPASAAGKPAGPQPLPRGSNQEQQPDRAAGLPRPPGRRNQSPPAQSPPPAAAAAGTARGELPRAAEAEIAAEPGRRNPAAPVPQAPVQMPQMQPAINILPFPDKAGGPSANDQLVERIWRLEEQLSQIANSTAKMADGGQWDAEEDQTVLPEGKAPVADAAALDFRRSSERLADSVNEGLQERLGRVADRCEGLASEVGRVLEDASRPAPKQRRQVAVPAVGDDLGDGVDDSRPADASGEDGGCAESETDKEMDSPKERGGFQKPKLEQMDEVISEIQRHLSLYGRFLGGHEDSTEADAQDVGSDAGSFAAPSCSPSLTSLLRRREGVGAAGREDTSAVLATILSMMERLSKAGIVPGVGGARGSKRRWGALGEELRRLRAENDLENERVQTLRQAQLSAVQDAERDFKELSLRVAEVLPGDGGSCAGSCCGLLLEELEKMEEQKKTLEAQSAARAFELYAAAEEAADARQEAHHSGSSQRSALLGRVTETLRRQLAMEQECCEELEAQTASPKTFLTAAG
ncbi:unnamed protein product [Polarella glacialis]|uniref:FHA domain-containing protein n=1 Tax=Polarella glacialis TaxID=89957 RepID=A0A813GQT2_POLGL|nr:unnamed protein product [Polarella glacialis]